uniref:DNA (cytosine-5-)-methyltransferase n=1 Tax=Cryptomonas curvata TaxID=233186 RepID=A0A7S0QCP4_9CRYP
MHFAALDWGRKSHGREIQVIQCFDVSELANKVYEFNFKKKPSVRSIEHLDSTYLDSLGADTWLMSPPCEVNHIPVWAYSAMMRIQELEHCFICLSCFRT